MENKTMTINELSKILFISGSSIKRSIRILFPDKMKNGIITRLNEIEVTLVKKDLERHHNTKYKFLNNQNLNEMKKFIGYDKEIRIVK
jgi:hypothetical protein